jgi:hypothetical protein
MTPTVEPSSTASARITVLTKREVTPEKLTILRTRLPICAEASSMLNALINLP